MMLANFQIVELTVALDDDRIRAAAIVAEALQWSTGRAYLCCFIIACNYCRRIKGRIYGAHFQESGAVYVLYEEFLSFIY